MIARVFAKLITEWEQLKRGWPNGGTSRVARWVPGCVVRMSISGVGGRRSLGITPETAQWCAWSGMVRDRRNVRGSPVGFAEPSGDAFDVLAQRCPSVAKWRRIP